MQSSCLHLGYSISREHESGRAVSPAATDDGKVGDGIDKVQAA
jgi:hypothetical protein